MTASETRMPFRPMLPPTLALLVGLLVPSLVWAQPAPGAAMGGSDQGPLPVGVITLEQADVPYEVTLPGRAVAYEQVSIRPRVNGVIAQIAYQPGRPVKVGDLLFRIDNETYEASVQSAEAEVASAKASLEGAQITLERYKKIEGTGISSADVKDAEVSLHQAEASVKTAEAALRTAKLNLEWTEIRSPISGIPEVADVSVGSIVTSNQTTALTTVTRLNPIYVDVQESSVRMLSIRNLVENGFIKRADKLSLKLQLETGETLDGEGTLRSPGTSVSTTTGTVALRMEFDNPKRMVIPGQFLRVDATLGTSEAILVPQGATQRASDGSLTVYVAREGKVAVATLDEIGSYQNNWIVTGGVETGDQIIVDNIRNLREGIEIKTIPVEYVDGVIKEVTDGDAAKVPNSNASGEAQPADVAEKE
ncbi:membrane fusion protein, multidrug efflux system [Cohaesibacter marisflavi]|uniref:Membrane fusion protein, multidrug efflux system n=1 Tax=Cohaesibacter marisflavi TaxID=655353 RepID=A0A1I5CDG4_9HYPH|nr:efflux RND transporter periplasmic adaptor subunit [Cohaesibacter marisflavi]SFN85049.1 membrane fusion protein, multidrug efflux system [Cohaesibacter marisflavi]